MSSPTHDESAFLGSSNDHSMPNILFHHGGQASLQLPVAAPQQLQLELPMQEEADHHPTQQASLNLFFDFVDSDPDEDNDDQVDQPDLHFMPSPAPSCPQAESEPTAACQNKHQASLGLFLNFCEDARDEEEEEMACNFNAQVDRLKAEVARSEQHLRVESSSTNNLSVSGGDGSQDVSMDSSDGGEIIVGVSPQGNIKQKDSLGKYEKRIGRQLKFEKPSRFIIDPRSLKKPEM